MKIIKSIFKFILILIITTLIALYITGGLKINVKYHPPTNADHKTEDSKPLSFTESPVQPERKPNISDIKYARALMSHPRSKITDIHVLNDYDGVIKTAKDNINNGVGNREDYELYNIWKDMNEYEQENN